MMLDALSRDPCFEPGEAVLSLPVHARGKCPKQKAERTKSKHDIEGGACIFPWQTFDPPLRCRRVTKVRGGHIEAGIHVAHAWQPGDGQVGVGAGPPRWNVGEDCLGGGSVGARREGRGGDPNLGPRGKKAG